MCERQQYVIIELFVREYIKISTAMGSLERNWSLKWARSTLRDMKNRIEDWPSLGFWDSVSDIDWDIVADSPS